MCSKVLHVYSCVFWPFRLADQYPLFNYFLQLNLESAVSLTFWVLLGLFHSRPQRTRSFWSAPRITTSGPVQRHSVFEWLCKHNRLRPEPIRFVKLDSGHAQSDGKSVNRGLPVLDLARGRDSWCWPKGARPLGTRMGLFEFGKCNAR